MLCFSPHCTTGDASNLVYETISLNHPASQNHPSRPDRCDNMAKVILRHLFILSLFSFSLYCRCVPIQWLSSSSPVVTAGYSPQATPTLLLLNWKCQRVHRMLTLVRERERERVVILHFKGMFMVNLTLYSKTGKITGTSIRSVTNNDYTHSLTHLLLHRLYYISSLHCFTLSRLHFIPFLLFLD